ncbi:MAG: type II toxin-antitoxin system HicA family toxin [Candidatus Micrarchaeaceae archaeon]|jgi:predicted RNA binding protein YcfA (HicA-like mRNA interferase family)|nr:type II toxin-antitoxin system HicA family toxin [Candidatus Micrarchaeota archaeon]HII10293.1 type II toxin-antitoxin system HicA family toxin [Candidatus Micrarchaeota archaeon]
MDATIQADGSTSRHVRGAGGRRLGSMRIGEVGRVLDVIGFVRSRGGGNSVVFTKGADVIRLPNHGGKEISAEAIRHLLRHGNVTEEQFLASE